ncbi:IS630 transposase-related protein, partial [Vicingaceae bacterium]|nr:IS630 transposase-related protein [Vicingaceae bacterium]
NLAMNKTEQHKKAVIEALESSLGIVTTACKKVGVGRTTFYQWLKEDEEFAKQVKDIENVALDFAETQLHQQIKDNVPTSTIFYLKTKGKKRGYIERMETENTNKNLDLSNLTDEELEERLKQAKRVTDG